MNHTLSIVICTKDREESLKVCLDSIFRQTRKPNEAVIVDDGNLDRDEIIKLVERNGIHCKYFKKEMPGLTTSRNLGIRNSGGDVALFLDDDVILDENYIEGIMEVYEVDKAHRIGGVEGVVRYEHRPAVQLFGRLFGLSSKRPGVILPNGIGTLVREGAISAPINVQCLSGCNMSYRREVFRDFLFDEELKGYGWGEDRDFSFRVSQKYDLVATPEARLVHVEDPMARVSSRSMGFMETNYIYRFFDRHMPKRPINWLALAWAFVGIVLKNIILFLPASNRIDRLRQIWGNIEGIRAVRWRQAPVGGSEG